MNKTKVKKMFFRAFRPRSYSELSHLVFKKQAKGKRSDKIALQSALDWLLEIQKQKDKDGYPVQYSLIFGLDEPYPETTGYIIPTMLKAFKALKQNKYRNSAIQAGNWLLSIQNSDGSYNGMDGKKIIFDTGQIIFGLLALYTETKEEKYLSAAKKAGNWIVKQQHAQGYWKKYAFNNLPHSYYSRVSWALLELWNITQNDSYKKSAKKQSDWVLKQQTKNYFFKHCSFYDDEKPFLHTIAYTIEGLLESGILLNEQKYIDAAEKTADVLLTEYAAHDVIRGKYTADWKPCTDSLCITGIAQTLIVWQSLNKQGYKKYGKAIADIKEQLKSFQLQSKNSLLNGGIPGSYPVWGNYMPWSLPNWAAKFYADALL